MLVRHVLPLFFPSNEPKMHPCWDNIEISWRCYFLCAAISSLLSLNVKTYKVEINNNNLVAWICAINQPNKQSNHAFESRRNSAIKLATNLSSNLVNKVIKVDWATQRLNRQPHQASNATMRAAPSKPVLASLLIDLPVVLHFWNLICFLFECFFYIQYSKKSKYLKFVSFILITKIIPARDPKQSCGWNCGQGHSIRKAHRGERTYEIIYMKPRWEHI